MTDENPARRTDRATVRDVARLAGVSDISVSRVMRNAPHTSDALRERVMQAAQRLGYTPNRVAGALKARSSNLVAVIVPSMSNAVFPEVLDGIESVLTESGLQAVLGITQYDRTREAQIVQDMLAWAPAGVILTGTDQNAPVRDLLTREAIPVVQMMDIDGDPLQSAVGISHAQAARVVADYLVERGYRRCGYIGAWGERPARSRARRLSFEARLAELGYPLIASLIRDEKSSVEAGSRATAEFLAANRDIDCVFYANDDLAVGGYFHCLAKGIAVPDRLGIVGFNGIELGQSLPTPLTTVRTPRFSMGRKSAAVLLRLREGKETMTAYDLGFDLLRNGTA